MFEAFIESINLLVSRLGFFSQMSALKLILLAFNPDFVVHKGSRVQYSLLPA